MMPALYVVLGGVLFSVILLFSIINLVQVYKMHKHTRDAITAIEATSELTKCFAWFPKQMTDGGTLWLEWGYRICDGGVFWFRESPNRERKI